jgi:Membrane dipeptidase (Peptidase family M19)
VCLNGGCAEPQRWQLGGNRFALRSLHQKTIFEPRQLQLLRRVLRRAIELTLSESTKTFTPAGPFSHSNVLALNNNIRNISDDQIKGIADTGGLIGVNPVNAYLKWSTEDAPNAVTGPFPSLATLSQYVEVMDYIRGLVGIDYIGLGTDFTYGNPPTTPAPIFITPHHSRYLPRCSTILPTSSTSKISAE